MKSRLISLFSGCGGLDLGFRQAGFEVGAAYDVDPVALRSYARNQGTDSLWRTHRTRIHEADLSTIRAKDIIADWIEHEVLSPIGVIGGPPCQAFSASNVRKKPDDPRI